MAKQAAPFQLSDPEPLILDYGSAATAELMCNLSCAAAVKDELWTVSDEGRTLERLKRAGAGFVLERQYELDTLFGDLLTGDGDDEIDLEAMSYDGARLWLCGSHCRVRRKAEDAAHLDPGFRRRPSRHLFGSIAFDRDGAPKDGSAIALPATGVASLRRLMREDPYMAPFLKLPSKEGGLDIEGLLVKRGHAFLGLRGPLIDSMAVVMELSLSENLEDGAHVQQRHFVRLGGLGIRGLAAWGREILLIAGPVTDAGGPFRLFAWRPRRTEEIQEARWALDWPGAGEKPEGICPLIGAGGDEGLLVLFDSPEPKRISASRYRAEWRRISSP